MPISASCPCGKRYQFKDELAGRRAKCSACGRLFSIPRPDGAGNPLEDPPDAESEGLSKTTQMIGLGAVAFIVVAGGIFTAYLVFRSPTRPVIPQSPAASAPTVAAAPATAAMAPPAAPQPSPSRSEARPASVPAAAPPAKESAARAPANAEKTFLEMVGMGDYWGKLNHPYDETGRYNIPMPTQALDAGTWTNIYREGGDRLLGWRWKPADERTRKLTVEEIRKACGPPTGTHPSGSAWWGRVGFLTQDGKTISELFVYPEDAPWQPPANGTTAPAAPVPSTSAPAAQAEPTPFSVKEFNAGTYDNRRVCWSGTVESVAGGSSPEVLVKVHEEGIARFFARVRPKSGVEAPVEPKGAVIVEGVMQPGANLSQETVLETARDAQGNVLAGQVQKARNDYTLTLNEGSVTPAKTATREPPTSGSTGSPAAGPAPTSVVAPAAPSGGTVPVATPNRDQVRHLLGIGLSVDASDKALAALAAGETQEHVGLAMMRMVLTLKDVGIVLMPVKEPDQMFTVSTKAELRKLDELRRVLGPEEGIEKPPPGGNNLTWYKFGWLRAGASGNDVTTFFVDARRMLAVAGMLMREQEAPAAAPRPAVKKAPVAAPLP